MNRRKRCDSIEGEQQIFQDVKSGPPLPPPGVEISEAVRPFWVSVTMSKAKRAWTPNDLVSAAELARCMFRLEFVSRQIEASISLLTLRPDEDLEGVDIIQLEKLADLLAKRIRLLSAHLQVHPEATQGKSMKQVEQNRKNSAAIEAMRGGADSLDALIPGINPQ
jgi:hypothetical protein